MDIIATKIAIEVRTKDREKIELKSSRQMCFRREIRCKPIESRHAAAAHWRRARRQNVSDGNRHRERNRGWGDLKPWYNEMGVNEEE